MRNLNNMLDGSGRGWTLFEASAVNNAGQIVGAGSSPSGPTHAFLLTPITDPPVLGFTEFNDPTLGAGIFTPGSADEELGFVTTTSASGGTNPLAGVTVGLEAGDLRVLTHRSINATTTFDAVDLANVDGAFYSLRMQVANTTYEASDFVRISVTNTVDTMGLVDFTGAFLNHLAGDGFLTWAAYIPDDWRKRRW